MIPELEFTQEHYQLISAALDKAEDAGILGTCEDHMDADGFCRMCTALQNFRYKYEGI